MLRVDPDLDAAVLGFVGPRGGGQLQLHSAAGDNMVEAGAGDNGVGIVRAGPQFQCAGTKMGLANPDCIIGRTNP